jgi:hypothetical protein
VLLVLVQCPRAFIDHFTSKGIFLSLSFQTYQKNVVYQADVYGDNKIMKYFGSTENFKGRYYKHKSSFKDRPANHTTLSSYVWKLKDKNIPFEVKWSIKARGHWTRTRSTVTFA